MDGAKHGEIYNLSGSEQYSVKKVVEVLESLIKKEAKIEYVGERLGDQKETITSSEKARQDFGYLPKTKLDEGLQKQISWQKNLLNL
jgi:UDP-glucose 4-epimerase